MSGLQPREPNFKEESLDYMGIQNMIYSIFLNWAINRATMELGLLVTCDSAIAPA